MGAQVLHGFSCTLSDTGSSGTPGGPVGPAEWNAAHQLYLDVNAQTGTSYTLAATDSGALVTFSNAAAIALAVPAAIAGAPANGDALGFYRGWFCYLKNLGASTVTLTPASGTINGKAAETLPPGHYGKLISDGVNYQLLRNSLQENATPLPQSYLAGMQLSNDGTTPNTVLDISPGHARDSSNVFNLVSTAIFTKSIAGAWAAGSGANGMGNGLTAAVSTWYHAHAILLSSGATDFYFDTSATAANAPTGTIAYRRLGSFKTNGSTQIIAFAQSGDRFDWAVPVQDVSAATTTAAATQTLPSIPSGVSVEAILSGAIWDGTNIGSTLYISSLSQTDETPNQGGRNGFVTVVSPSTTANSAGSYSGLRVNTNTSAQVRTRSNVTTADFTINSSGWIDRRGRDV